MAIARFHTLTVADRREETVGSFSIGFAVPPSLNDDYAYEAGQYLTLRAMIDGEELRRSYSICTAPEEGALRIGIKRVEGGQFTAWAATRLQPGCAVDVMTPTGRFGPRGASDGGRVIAAFAAGSGITPVLSILKATLARDPRSRVFLFYGNRSTDEIMFRGELEALKDRHLGRLSVLHILSREEQDLSILNGRLDSDKARLMLRHIVPAETLDEVLICGPDAMSEEIAPAVRAAGVPEDRVHVERFTSSLAGRPRVSPPRPPVEETAPHRAVLVVDGKRREIPVANDEPVLDAALRAGIDLPYACKGGMCSTCRARVVEGEARMAVNFSLDRWEVEAGYVLTCQARMVSERAVFDYDAV